MDQKSLYSYSIESDRSATYGSWLVAFLRRTMAAHIHLFAFFAAVLVIIPLVDHGFSFGTSHGISLLIYSLSASFVFGVSSLYHYLHDGFGLSAEQEQLFEKLDHAAIYLTIAGTYTAVMVGLIDAPWRIEILGVTWSIGIAGLIYTFCWHKLPAAFRNRWLYTALFVVMGWSFLVRAPSIYAAMDPIHVIWFIFAGGSYTVGALVYAMKWPDPWPGVIGFHELWHMMVVAGWLGFLALIHAIYF